MTAIYSLRDPINGKVRYIGKTHYPLHKRLKGHVRETRRVDRAHDRKNRWINSLLIQGLIPRISLVEQVPRGERWEEYEKLWIAKYRVLLGGALLNHTKGGQNGPPKGCVKSLETRIKIAASLRGRHTSRIGYRHFLSTLKKMAASRAKSNYVATEEHRRRLSDAHKGRKRSTEARRNMSEAAKKRIATESGRNQLIASSKKGLEAARMSPRVGYRHSEETKRKLSEAARRCLSTPEVSSART